MFHALPSFESRYSQEAPIVVSGLSFTYPCPFVHDSNTGNAFKLYFCNKSDASEDLKDK